MITTDLHTQLKRLVSGLSDQLIRNGTPLTYDGGTLSAEEAEDLCLSSFLCLGNDLAFRVGLEEIGYRFELDDTPSPVFPLRAVQAAPRPFNCIAPFVVEAFERYASACSFDAAKLFEAAARTLAPGYTLSLRTTYESPSSAPGQSVGASPFPMRTR